jgi:Protein of unknown function (DUF3995)
MVEGAGDVPGATSDTRRRWPGWAAYAATTWAFVFALVHLYWALGGTAGLPKGMSVDVNPALFVIDVLAVPLCLVGALLALSLVRPWGRRIPRRLLLAGAWAVCALLVVHSAPTLVAGGLVVTDLSDAEPSVLERWSLFVYEPWFFMGGILYGTAAWGYDRRSSRPEPASPDRRPLCGGASKEVS